ncbi:matrix extracellular phosphoglycoprotein isoform X2 [Balaenoptera acutorostrata]|uniref:Matrix extracellular phosphoglycoprotein isoform X2 n=1 Tax=Balaenoptera acutorostrata TaxID=9767 RepID=A0A384A9Y7_BALAC|nr:matrix extracellular phosphoglycoprotein isoform X2 [Balaenoptera acutorostrata]
MRIICLGLLLFSLTLAAPTLQPQAEKMKQDSVEEQRIMYKGHHEKHGYYVFKYVYTSSGRKNQTDVKEEKNKDNIALPHSGKRRNQEPAPKENIVQEKEKDLSLPGTNENNKSTKSQSLLENRQTMKKDYRISNKENAHNDLKMFISPESTGNHGTEDGDNAISKLHDQEESGKALIRNNMHHIMEPGAVIELLREEIKENKLRNVLSKVPAGANYAKAPSKIKKNHHRDSHAQNIPVKSKSTHRIQHNMDYLKQLPKVKKVSSDFEGSGYPDLQGREDNDLSPFSGDGPPFKDISGKGDAIRPDREGADIQTEFSSPSEAGTINPDARGPGYNEIPEKEGNGGNTIGTRDETAQKANAADVSLVEGSNNIIGSTNFKKLPGKEGSRVDGGSQNAHQGKIEFHYPHAPTEDKRKDGSSDGAESINEIPKNGKGSSRKDTEHSNRNQATSNEKQRFPSKGKGQGQFIPSRGLDNEIKNEIGSHNGPNNEGTIITHSRKNYYVPHNSMQNKGVSQSKGSWGYRKPHSNRRFRPPKKHDSSESSDSGSSSESDGD